MIISVDTETDPHYTPFIATSTDQMLKSTLYNVRNNNHKDYQKLKRVCEDPKITKVMHPVTFDSYALSRIGINVKGPVEDTYIAASLINEEFESRKLKDLARVYLDADTSTETELKKIKTKYRALAKKQGIEFGYHQIPKEVLEPYAIDDAVYTLKLYHYFKDRLKKYSQVYEFEKSLIPIILDMEKHGMMIDRKFAKKMIKQYRHEKDVTYEWMVKYLKRRHIDGANEFNPGSPKQIGEVLQQLKLGELVKTEKEHIATDAQTLQNNYGNNPFIKQLLLYRFCAKQGGTYFEPLYNHYTSTNDPYAHFMLWQSGTRTGRFSAELIQTIPRREESKIVHAPKLARKAFIPRPGYWIVCIDYKAIEMRLFFSFANAKHLIQKVKGGWDPHDATCQNLFGNIDSQNRRLSKDINFGMIFGMGKQKLMLKLGRPLDECRKIIDDYYKLVPVLDYMSIVKGAIFRNGYITIEYDSDLMSFTRDYWLPSNRAYKACNTVVQGTAAYVMKYGMKRVIGTIRKHGMNVTLLTTAHDELIFEVSKKEPLHRVIPILKNAMEDHQTFKLPILTEVKYSDKSWGDVVNYQS